MNLSAQCQPKSSSILVSIVNLKHALLSQSPQSQPQSQPQSESQSQLYQPLSQSQPHPRHLPKSQPCPKP